jgi:two-component system C4-dicarboxylate transport sensor histidine kinase DctB
VPVVRAIETSNTRVLDLLQQLRILLQSHESSDREPVDLRALVQRTLPILEGSFRESGVLLNPVVPGGPAEVLASATQLQQLLLILCTQALDECRRLPSRPSGGQVQVSLEADARQVRLRVEDSGQRTGAQLRQQMQAAATSGGRERLGLGLAVAQRVAQAHHGQLQIRDSALGGAAFVLTLPSAQAARETASSALAITPPPRHTSPS